jgi:hypothetical protein
VSARPALVLDIDTAVAHVRAGRPVTISTGTEAVTALPASLLHAATGDELAARGPLAVVLARTPASRLRVRSGPVRLDDGDTVATVRALASPWATRDQFVADPAGVPVTIVADTGVVAERGLAVLATELSELAGFGRATVVVPTDPGAGDPAVVASDLLCGALRARGPLRATGPARMPLPAGPFSAWSVAAWDGVEHVVLVPEPGRDGPVRVVPACVIGQGFAPAGCGCRRALDDALADAAATGAGTVVVLQAPRRALAWGPCGAADDDPAVGLLVDLAVAAVARAGRARTA